MEEYTKKVRQGQDADEDALRDLGLTKVNYIPPVILDKARISELQKHFAIMGRIACGAKLLGRETLLQACEHFMGIILFVAKFKLKKKLIFHPARDDILETMESMVNSTKTFLNSIRESTAEANLARVLTMIRRAQNGDKECIKFFKLSKLPLLQLDLVRKVPYFSSLQNQFNCYQTYALGGEHLKDDAFKVVATALCSYINWIARESEPNRQIVCKVDGSDICTSLLEELHFITNFMSDCQWKLREFDRKERQRECDDIEEELEDPSYDPEVDDGEEEDESEESEGSQGVEAASCEENFPRAATTKAVKRKETSDDPKPPAKKPKVTADPKPPANKPTVSKEEKKKEGKHSHHAKRICRICNKQESNLRRYLQSHARKGLIEPGAVERFLSVATRKGKRRGPRRKSGDTVKKGLRMKWCPFPGCELVTHQLRSHLTHKHRLKP